MKTLILAIGKMKRDGALDLLQEYEKRLKGKLTVKEFDIKESNPAKMQQLESEALLKHIPEGS